MAVTPRLSFTRAVSDPMLLGNVLGGDSWVAHRAMWKAVFCEPLTDDEQPYFDMLSGARDIPAAPVSIAAIVAGRRSGKTRSTAAAIVWLACLCDWSAKLVSGETGAVVAIAPSQAQAKLLFGYVAGIIDDSPVLAQMVTNRTADSIKLDNGIEVMVRPASFRKLRGLTICALVVDEVAWLFNEADGSRNSDEEILHAAIPALATTGGPLVMISSPYRKTGVLWDYFNRYFGNDSDPDVLVFRGASLDLNPTLSPRIVERALAKDFEAARAEWLAEFRTDLSSYVSHDAVMACVEMGRAVRHYVEGQSYVGFVDVAGGQGKDSYTLGIAHREEDQIYSDLVAEVRPPFSPDAVTAEFAALCKQYGIGEVLADKFAGSWPAESWEKHGIRYRAEADPKSVIYAAFLPLVSGGKVSLLDHERSLSQLLNLERRTGRGRDTIDHPRGMHDDCVNVIAGAAVMAAQPRTDFTKRLAGW